MAVPRLPPRAASEGGAKQPPKGKTRVEIRDGREWTITTLPQDKRLTPSATRERQLFQALSTRDKKAFIRERITRARKHKRRPKASAAKRTSG